MSMTIGQAIQAAREAKGFTASQAAQKLGCWKDRIVKYEQDAVYPGTITLIAMARLYECSIDKLVGRYSAENEEYSEYNQGWDDAMETVRRCLEQNER